MPNNRLPDFLVIGSMRCGTTSLYRYLHAHPGAFLTPKELEFFTDHFSEGLDWYKAQFDGASPDQLLGEATADYFARPTAVERIAETVPDAKLIVSMRDPVKRAWSHYWLLRERGLESRPVQQALADELDAVATHGDYAEGILYLSHSMYARHLRYLRDRFPDDQIYVSIFERMIAEPHESYRAVCDFVGLDTDTVPDIVGRPVNAYVQFRSLALRGLAKRVGGLGGRIIGRLNTKRGMSSPDIDDASREMLDGFFAPRIEELRDLLDDQLPEWT